MQLSWKTAKYIGVILGIIATVIILQFLPVDSKVHPILYVFSAIVIFFASSVASWALRKAYFFSSFLNVKRKLSSESLNLIAARRGLPFSMAGVFGDNAVNPLLDLNLIELESFPPSGQIPTIYYFTTLGRLLLEKGLELEVYPEDFCRMFLLRFWEGYLDKFPKKTSEFERKYIIPWERSWAIFCEVFKRQFGQNGGQIREEEIAPLFDIYVREEEFNSIKDRLIGPWKQQVEKERRFKFLRLYRNFRIIPFWMSY